jgi:hypothetical protein
MSISKKAIVEATTLYFSDLFDTSKANLRQKSQTYLGEYSDFFMSFLIMYCAQPKNKPLNATRFYSVFVKALAAEICRKMQTQDSLKIGIPMLPELEQGIENLGYSFTMLRGTSYLCEVQISTK